MVVSFPDHVICCGRVQYFCKVGSVVLCFKCQQCDLRSFLVDRAVIKDIVCSGFHRNQLIYFETNVVNRVSHGFRSHSVGTADLFDKHVSAISLELTVDSPNYDSFFLFSEVQDYGLQTSLIDWLCSDLECDYNAELCSVKADSHTGDFKPDMLFLSDTTLRNDVWQLDRTTKSSIDDISRSSFLHLDYQVFCERSDTHIREVCAAEQCATVDAYPRSLSAHLDDFDAGGGYLSACDEDHYASQTVAVGTSNHIARTPDRHLYLCVIVLLTLVDICRVCAEIQITFNLWQISKAIQLYVCALIRFIPIDTPGQWTRVACFAHTIYLHMICVPTRVLRVLGYLMSILVCYITRFFANGEGSFVEGPCQDLKHNFCLQRGWCTC